MDTIEVYEAVDNYSQDKQETIVNINDILWMLENNPDKFKRELEDLKCKDADLWDRCETCGEHLEPVIHLEEREYQGGHYQETITYLQCSDNNCSFTKENI